MTTRSALREATVGTPSVFKNKLVKYNELEFEVREISPGVREQVRRKAENQVLTKKNGDQEFILDAAKYTAHLIVMSTYVPGTQELVFEAGDVKAILNSPSGGFYKSLGDAASELMVDAAEEGNE